MSDAARAREAMMGQMKDFNFQRLCPAERLGREALAAWDHVKWLNQGGNEVAEETLMPRMKELVQSTLDILSAGGFKTPGSEVPTSPHSSGRRGRVTSSSNS